MAGVVCLTDGREYTIGETPLRLGRDAGSDVVVSGHEVSRQHAEIQRDPDGYLLVDNSVNGTYVNGERVGKTHRLSRADVIRIGNDEFRFYADARASGPQSAILLAAESDPVPNQPPGGAAQRLSDTMHGIPASEPGATLRPLRPDCRSPHSCSEPGISRESGYRSRCRWSISGGATTTMS